MSAVLVVAALAVAVAVPAALGGLALAWHRRAALEAARVAEARRRQALALHDNVVQGLARVTWALEASGYEHARAAADATLRDAQAMITMLLEEHPDGAGLGPGSLRREDALQQPSNASGPALLGPMHP